MDGRIGDDTPSQVRTPSAKIQTLEPPLIFFKISKEVWEKYLVKSFFYPFSLHIVKTTDSEKVGLLSKFVEMNYVNQNGFSHFGMQFRFPVENSVDSVENLRICPMFPGFSLFVPFCNYWIKVCIIYKFMQRKIDYGNKVWKLFPV